MRTHPWLVLLAIVCSSGCRMQADTTAPPDVHATTADRWQVLREQADAATWPDGNRARFVRLMPKIETHLHLDGALRPKLIAELAQTQGYAPLQGLSEAEIAERTVVPTPREDLAAVLEVFSTLLPLLRTREALERATFDVLMDAHGDNVRYVEVRFAPALLAVPEQGFDDAAVLDTVLTGLENAHEAFGIEGAVIVCLIRTLPREANERMLDAAIAAHQLGRPVVAIDLAGDEAAVPLTEFADLYRRAGEAGLYRTVHAGEVAGSHDLQTALALGVDRIGHGTFLDAQPELFAEVVRRGLGIEVNVTSNYRTSAIAQITDHPAKRWFDAGANISVSTDDPGVFDITLTGEYELLIDALGFSIGDLIELQRRSLATAFLPAADKQRLETDVLAQLEDLLHISVVLP